jgi:hypothetical protein
MTALQTQQKGGPLGPPFCISRFRRGNPMPIGKGCAES